MGELTEMILDGLLDAATGEYIGHKNKRVFGEEAPGFPVSYDSNHDSYFTGQWFKGGKKKRGPRKTEACPVCGKMVAAGGLPLQQHIESKHSHGGAMHVNGSRINER